MFDSLGLELVNFYALSALINFTVSLVFGLFIFLKDKGNRVNQTFAIFALSLATWSGGYVLWQISQTPEAAIFWSRGFMMGAIFVTITFFHFTCVLVKQTHKWRWWLRCGYGLFVLFALSNLTPHFVTDVAPIMNFPYWPQPGLLYHPYLFLWAGYLVLATYILIQVRNTTKDLVLKKQILFVLAAMLVIFINGPINYFPWYGIPIPPVTTIFVSFYVLIIGYAVLRYNLFNVRVIATELLVLFLNLFVLIRAILSTTFQEQIINGVLLISTIGIGALLVWVSRREVQAKEKIESLAHDLEKANKRLMSLDKQKSEFVSIASHQLRSPLTSIRGYSSMLLEGSFGPFPEKAREPLARIEESSKLMALAIEDYLNVSRIESGNMKYNFTDFNLRNTTEKLCDDLRPDAIKRGLMLVFRSDLKSQGVVHADLGKTVQIIQNLVHNAIKYTQEGSVKVLVRDDLHKKRIHIDIIDTGIGMDEETQHRLFQKFERAKDAHTVNTDGTGLGLYVAHQMTEAMHGSIEAHSDGPGKGSRFTISMPLGM